MDNEQVSEALAEILQFLKDGLESGVEFASEQAPILIQEILSWGIVINTAALLLSLSIPLTALIICWRVRVWLTHTCECTQWKETIGSDQETAWILGHWVIPVASVMWTVAALSSYMPTILKIMVAPRLYLIEQVRHLIR